MELPGLRARRVRALLSQSELAAMAGVSRLTVIHIEHGKSAQYKTIRKLLDALGACPDDVIGKPGWIDPDDLPQDARVG